MTHTTKNFASAGADSWLNLLVVPKTVLNMTDGEIKNEIQHLKSKKCRERGRATRIKMLERELSERALARKQIKDSELPVIERVLYNAPYTIVLWADKTKTIVRAEKGTEYSPYYGLALCITKKAMGNSNNYGGLFKKWLPIE